jgi:transposase
MSQGERTHRIPPELDAEMTPAVRAFVLSLFSRIDELTSEVQRLSAEVQKLSDELGRGRKTPQNSSLPPSSTHPHAKPVGKKPRSKKKRGGQPGHPRHQRALIPSDQCDEVVTLMPTTCRRCKGPLSGTDPEPWRHQVWELPEIKPQVIEYQQHRLYCPCCQKTTCAALPPGVPQSQAGPRLVAMVALLMGCFRQSKSRVALFLEQVLGQPCSPGWVVKLQRQATAALQPAYQELVDKLPEEDHLRIDETATKEANHKSWLWTCVAAAFTVFAIRPTRAATVLRDLLGVEYEGIVSCDRAKMYFMFSRLQWCWAHLKRDFQALIDHPDRQVERLGHDLMRPTRELFRHWARYRDGTLSRRGFQRLMQPIRVQVEALLLRGACSGNPRLMGMCEELWQHRDWLWCFVDYEGVEPTNNASERALRHAVIWRKLSFGTQSDHGSRFVETMLTVIETCRQQSHNVFAFLTASIEAHFAQQPAPSLIPAA